MMREHLINIELVRSRIIDKAVALDVHKYC